MENVKKKLNVTIVQMEKQKIIT